MPVLRRSSPLAAVAVALLAVAGCGSGDASRESVQGTVEDLLIDQDVPPQEALEAAQCVANTMFDGQSFTPEERNAVARSRDGDDVDPGLVDRVVDLVDGCRREAGAGGGGGEPSDRTTTTDGEAEG